MKSLSLQPLWPLGLPFPISSVIFSIQFAYLHLVCDNFSTRSKENA